MIADWIPGASRPSAHIRMVQRLTLLSIMLSMMLLLLIINYVINSKTIFERVSGFRLVFRIVLINISDVSYHILQVGWVNGTHGRKL